MFDLRDYQKDQINFLKKHIGKDGSMFDSNISLQSPTGSGKSVTMLTFLKDYLYNNRYSKVFISTGFNELVFQIAEDAMKMGIPTKILIGKNNMTCVKKVLSKGYEADDFEAFEKSIPPSLRYDQTQCKYCSIYSDGNCYWQKTVSEIERGGVLVITNHSTYFQHSDLFDKFDGGFIDECQTFADFYELYKSVNISAKDIYNIIDAAKDDSDLKKSIELAVVRSSVERGALTPKALGNLLNMSVTKSTFSRNETYVLADKYNLVATSCDKWLKINDPEADNVFVHPQYEGGYFNGVNIDVFFDKIQLNKNVCIVSATVDDYTKSILGVQHSYNERNCKITDYSKSSLSMYSSFDMQSIYDFISKQTAKHGLVLSTRLDIVNELKSKRFICGYEIVSNVADLKPGKRQILVGSKTLFQGVNIPSVGFILINKIPFSRYDDSYKKKMAYFDKLGRNSYMFYTIPYVTNQLIQCMGRLWRSPGDYGNIAIFDRKACIKHKSILMSALSYRDGIKVNWRQESDIKD